MHDSMQSHRHPKAIRTISLWTYWLDQRLQRANIRRASGIDQRLWKLFADAEPLLLVLPQLIGVVLAPARVLIVVQVNLCMALEANGNCVFNVVRSLFATRDNMI